MEKSNPRQNEIDCLNNIKDALRGDKRIEIHSNCEINSLSYIFFSACSNSNPNEFPDFVFDGGGIEHFELSSSKETNKGASFKIEENQNIKAKEEFYQKENEKLASTSIVPGTIRSITYEEKYEGFSYEDFLYSLERNIKKHVESLNKSSFHCKTIIFLMEQQTARLTVDEGFVPHSFYYLSKDQKALSTIKQYCGDISYLVYFVADSIEIIDLSKIDNLLEHSVIYKNVVGGRLIREKINLIIDI